MKIKVAKIFFEKSIAKKISFAIIIFVVAEVVQW